MAFEKDMDMAVLRKEDIDALLAEGLEDSEPEETSLDDAIQNASRKSSGKPLITKKRVDDDLLFDGGDTPEDLEPVHKPHTDLLGGYGSNENENNSGKNLGEKK